MLYPWLYGNDEERMCGLLRAAGALFHELLHAAGLPKKRADGEDIHPIPSNGEYYAHFCNPWNLLENTFLYGLHYRTGEVARESCCGGIRAPHLWMSSCTQWGPILLPNAANRYYDGPTFCVNEERRFARVERPGLIDVWCPSGYEIEG